MNKTLNISSIIIGAAGIPMMFGLLATYGFYPKAGFILFILAVLLVHIRMYRVHNAIQPKSKLQQEHKNQYISNDTGGILACITVLVILIASSLINTP